MAIQLVSAQSLARVNGVKCTVYARAGVGKTVLSCTAPGPVLVSAEAGVLSLSRENLVRIFGEGAPGITYDIPVIEVNSIQDLTEAELWARTSREAAQFQTICIDSISEIAEKILANAKPQVKDARLAYTAMIDQMVTTLKAFRDLKGKNVYMAAKEEKSKNEATGSMLYGPSMPGAKLGPQIPYLVDEVFHLGVATNPQSNESYRYLRTQPDFTHDAKDRSGALDEIEYPHLGYIFNKILGSAQY